MKKLICAVCIAALCAGLSGCARPASSASQPQSAPSSVPVSTPVPSPSPTPAPTPTPTPAPERWGTVLKSELAGLEMQVPSEWEVAGREELLTMAGLDASATEEALSSVPLRYEILARDPAQGVSAMVSLMNLEQTGSTDVSTPQQAAEVWQQWLQDESPDYTFSDPVALTLAGQDAVLLPAHMGKAIQMDCYLWVNDGYVVCVTLSYPQAQSSVMARVLNSILALE